MATTCHRTLQTGSASCSPGTARAMIELPSSTDKREIQQTHGRLLRVLHHVRTQSGQSERHAATGKYSLESWARNRKLELTILLSLGNIHFSKNYTLSFYLFCKWLKLEKFWCTSGNAQLWAASPMFEAMVPLPWSCHDLGKGTITMQDRAKANHGYLWSGQQPDVSCFCGCIDLRAPDAALRTADGGGGLGSGSRGVSRPARGRTGRHGRRDETGTTAGGQKQVSQVNDLFLKAGKIENENLKTWKKPQDSFLADDAHYWSSFCHTWIEQTFGFPILTTRMVTKIIYLLIVVHVLWRHSSWLLLQSVVARRLRHAFEQVQKEYHPYHATAGGRGQIGDTPAER